MDRHPRRPLVAHTAAANRKGRGGGPHRWFRTLSIVALLSWIGFVLLCSVAFLNGFVVVEDGPTTSAVAYFARPPAPPPPEDCRGLSRFSSSSSSIPDAGVATRDSDVDPVVTGDGDDGGDGDDDDGGLRCERFGGPSDEAAAEMAYWKDVDRGDAAYVSPYYFYPKPSGGGGVGGDGGGDGGARRSSTRRTKYLTFELDGAGFNNQRMTFENCVVMAHAMGRTLVIPPKYYLGTAAGDPRSYFDFYDLDRLRSIYAGIDVISTEEYLARGKAEGLFRDRDTKKRVGLPQNRTDWDGAYSLRPLREFLRTVSYRVGFGRWSHHDDECIVALADRPGADGLKSAKIVRKLRVYPDESRPKPDLFKGRPVPVDGTPLQRLSEMLGERTKFCFYEVEMQRSRLLHFPNDERSRLLAHFYSNVFFVDWRRDLYSKRLVRDGLRFRDEIVCAAARIVEALRKTARALDPKGNPRGTYDALHVRRDDFQEFGGGDFDETGDMIANRTGLWVRPKSVVYVATDEADRTTFFSSLKAERHVFFLDDFAAHLDGVDPNYHPVIEQFVAARGDTFTGMYSSTFTGFINRLRGYYSVAEKLEGYEEGRLMKSHHYNVLKKVEDDLYQVYRSTEYPVWKREFPTAWRNIDASVGLMDTPEQT